MDGFTAGIILLFGCFTAIPGCVLARESAPLRGMLAILSALLALYGVARLVPHGGVLLRHWPFAILGACAMTGLSLLMARRTAARAYE